jgi:Spy/CpxP family protein refolding chaperone
MRKLSTALVISACLAVGFAFGAESAKKPAFGSQTEVHPGDVLVIHWDEGS